MAQSWSAAAVATGAPPVAPATVYCVDDVRPWMNAMASTDPLLSLSYWIASPTPTLLGRPTAKVAVVPAMVRLFPAPVARAEVLPGPTER